MTEDANDTVEGCENQAREVQVCLNCLTPVDPLQHFCHKCGQTVGRLSPYIPFVNIQYNYSPFGRMWRRIWYSRKRRFGVKVLYFLMILLFAPVMLIGLPFVLWWLLGRRSRERAEPGERGPGDDEQTVRLDEPPWYDRQDGS